MHGKADQGNQIGQDMWCVGPLDLGLFQSGIGIPKIIDPEMVRRLFDQPGQLLDIFKAQAALVRLAVEKLQGGDFVAVVGQELLERLDHGLDLFQSLDGKTGIDHLIFTDVVDDLLVLLLDLDQEVAQGRIMERFGCLDNQFCGGLFDLLCAGPDAACVLPGPFDLIVGLDGGDQIGGQLLDGLAAGKFDHLAVNTKWGTLVLKQLAEQRHLGYIDLMPRKSRMDAPGTLHHVMGRGIERTKIFRNQKDREDFLARLAILCRDGLVVVYAWALMPNHFHLLLRTGQQPLSTSMRKLLTGYVVNFNKRHKRSGHLFQNRYKSIVCEDDPYLLELTRYIHLNPLRAGLVDSLAELNEYPWSGHSVLMGTLHRDWQDQATVLAYFALALKEAQTAYERFVREGVAAGRRPELVGGGLIRSLGDWSQVISLRRKGETPSSDARILGRSDFVDRLHAEAEDKEKATLRLAIGKKDLSALLATITRNEGVDASAVRSGGRKREVVRARKLLSQIAVCKMGYSGAEVARFLGLSTSAVNRLASSKELPECGNSFE